MSGISGFFKAVAGICETKELSSHLWELEAGKATIKPDQVPELKKDGGSVYLKGKDLKLPVLIFHDEGNRFLAFADRCSHIGHRKLDFHPETREIRCCSVFHSTYDYKGNRLKGPARDSLKRYDVKYIDGSLIVYVGK